MARRSNTVLLSVGMLSAGLALGGHLQGIRVTAPAQAVATRGAALTSGADVLMLGGDHIGQVAAAAMPSTVHIQAVRRESDGRKVEETGSGVVMRAVP